MGQKCWLKQFADQQGLLQFQAPYISIEMTKKELVTINHKSIEYDSFCYNKISSKIHHTMQHNAKQKQKQKHRTYREVGGGAQHSKTSSVTYLKRIGT